MNRITFLFLALLIASCILTVNSRHETRTVITEKSVLNERVNSLQETIRRLELDKARLAAKGGAEDETCEPAAETAGRPVAPVADDDGPDAASAPAATATKAPAVTAPATPVKASAPVTTPASPKAPAAAPTPAALTAAKAKPVVNATDVEDDPLAAALAKMEAKAKAKAEKN